MRKFVRFTIVFAGIIVVPLAFSLPAWASQPKWLCTALGYTVGDGWQSARNGHTLTERAEIVGNRVMLIAENAGKSLKTGEGLSTGLLLSEFWNAGYKREKEGAPKAQSVTNIMSQAGCRGVVE